MLAAWNPIPVLTDAPLADPVSLDEAKLHCRVDHDDEDDLFRLWISAAVLCLQDHLDQQMVTATYTLKLPSFYPLIELPYPPLQAVNSVKYLDAEGDQQTLSPTVYEVVTSARPGFIRTATLSPGWPAVYSHPEAVEIEYDAGFGGTDAVPQRLKQAILLLVGHWYRTREPVTVGAVMKVPQTLEWIISGAGSYRF